MLLFQGHLEFYNSESDFLNSTTNMKNSTPIDLTKYIVESDIR
jgi:hypothetical protein